MTELFAEFENQSDLGDRMILDAFQGVTLAYAISPYGRYFSLCRYELTPITAPEANESLRQTRAYREMRRHRGKNPPMIEEDALRNELFIVPGAALSPAEVVKCLRAFILEIETNGMFIGEHRGHFIREKIDGHPPFERR